MISLLLALMLAVHVAVAAGSVDYADPEIFLLQQKVNMVHTWLNACMRDLNSLLPVSGFEVENPIRRDLSVDDHKEIAAIIKEAHSAIDMLDCVSLEYFSLSNNDRRKLSLPGHESTFSMWTILPKDYRKVFDKEVEAYRSAYATELTLLEKLIGYEEALASKLYEQ